MSVRSTLPLLQFFREDSIQFTPCGHFDPGQMPAVPSKPQAFDAFSRVGIVVAVNEIEGRESIQHQENAT